MNLEVRDQLRFANVRLRDKFTKRCIIHTYNFCSNNHNICNVINLLCSDEIIKGVHLLNLLKHNGVNGV